ncbi:MBL fold metallo-hydrolase [Microbispora sp. CA-135349]|uniref:MBL fold metallo-hydrolase n=1 Tax=Microbispora sp. CA-135349 TaxID=3239953 RepID=UPI003D8F1B24
MSGPFPAHVFRPAPRSQEDCHAHAQHRLRRRPGHTHRRYDHVGWNPRSRDGEWVPTFPNATYLIPRADNLYFDPDTAHRGRAPRDEHERVRWEGSTLVFNDSIAPVHRAGQAVLWEDAHRIDGNLLLEAAPGHTPGSSVLTLRSGTDRAVFVGDMLHSPVQSLKPAGTAASATTSSSRPRPAAPISRAPPNCARSSSRPTGRGTEPPRSGAMATASPSPLGPPFPAADSVSSDRLEQERWSLPMTCASRFSLRAGTRRAVSPDCAARGARGLPGIPRGRPVPPRRPASRPM